MLSLSLSTTLLLLHPSMAPADDFGVNVRVTRVEKKVDEKREQRNEDDDKLEGRSFFNCLACGYVHDAAAMRRSSGACHACGTIVRRKKREGEEGEDGAERRANALRDALVRFDEESSTRTTVIDDQGEYYDLARANAWLDDEEVAEEVAREAAVVRGGSAVGVDLLGRRFVVVGEEAMCREEEEEGEEAENIKKRHSEVSELERPWGGGRAVDAVGGAMKTKGGASGAFAEFLEGRGLSSLRFLGGGSEGTGGAE